MACYSGIKRDVEEGCSEVHCNNDESNSSPTVK